MKSFKAFAHGWTALPLVMALAAAPASAQVAVDPESRNPILPLPVSGPPAPATPDAEPESEIAFAADSVEYLQAEDRVTALGQVRMSRDGNYLSADKVTWTRADGQVVAEGNVVVVNPQGDRLVGERVVLTDTLRDGTVDNLLLVLDSGGRLAAERATRTGDVTTLTNAVYSPCPVTEECGGTRKPTWRIVASRVVQDSAKQNVRFERARLEIFGLSLPLLPVVSISTGDGTQGQGGILLPDLSYSKRLGLELSVPYHIRLATNRDVTVTPHLYTGTLPAIEARYRELNSLGAFQVGGFASYGDRTGFGRQRTDGFRGYFEGNGKYQLSRLWSITAQARAASDKTVTRFYDLNFDDRLRNFVNAERINNNSYISIAGWAFQGLRTIDIQRQIPIALPAIDARLRFVPPAIGGRVEVQANSLAIYRRDGQDTQRAFASARWDDTRLTELGQQLIFTGYLRGDVYHTDESAKTQTLIYRGEDGWQGRGIAALAAEARWPLIGPLAGGIQRLVPRVQLVLTPPTQNLSIPNEDSRSVDLEDSNLFSLNRFPGYDRWEDGSRVTYGVNWSLDRPNVAITSTIGQSYRLNRDARIFPEGTGLTDRFSDVVGRTRIQVGRFIDLTQRFRLDKTNLAIRRNELDLTVGTTETYARIGYLRLNRNVDRSVEDLRDKEELRFAGRYKFARYWSVFGATVLDLTDAEEDPLSLADGFDPVRHRVSVDYEDSCLEFGISWRRDYERFGRGGRGSTFALRLSLKGLGR